MGGVQGIGFALRTDILQGIGKDEIESGNNDALVRRRELYGKNELTKKPPKPLYVLCFEQLQDPMLLVLCIAGLISIIVGAIEEPSHGWIDGWFVFVFFFF